jgi:hypothetical protein
MPEARIVARSTSLATFAEAEDELVTSHADSVPAFSPEAAE